MRNVTLILLIYFVGSILMGLPASAHPASVSTGVASDGASSQDLPSTKDILKVIRKVNIFQMDRHSKEDFDQFFKTRRDMNQKMDILEKTSPFKSNPFPKAPGQNTPQNNPMMPPVHKTPAPLF